MEDKAMVNGMNRRSFLELGVAAGAVVMLPRAVSAQAASVAPREAQPHASAATTPIKTTRLYDNVYLLQGEGGNMALQTGPEGSVLIDSSFAPAVPRILETIAALRKDASAANNILINTHWHSDHTGGNQGMYEAGYTIYAHQNTRVRLSTPQTMRLFHTTTPVAPADAWPGITFDDGLHIWRNGDALDLVQFDPAHTDTDIMIHFRKANVIHVGDNWFNNFYPIVDESSGGKIDGMIRAGEKVLALADSNTRIIPGHGPLGTKADFQSFHDMLSAVREKVAALKASGASEQEAIAKKPAAQLDAVWGKGFMKSDTFVGVVYRTL
jgi:glyoxylase-like metal-dependent hydrolase (beta-lactamase superfamily II)